MEEHKNEGPEGTTPPRELASDAGAKLWEALINGPKITDGAPKAPSRATPGRIPAEKSEHEITLTFQQCSQISYLQKDLDHLVEDISILRTSENTDSKEGTAKSSGQTYLNFRTALSSLRSFVNGLSSNRTSASKTLTLNQLPQQWIEAFPKAREQLVQMISAVDEKLGNKCETSQQAEKVTPKGKAKPYVEYLKALDKVYEVLKAQLPIEQLAEKSTPSMFLTEEQKNKINLVDSQECLKSINEAGISTRPLTEMAKVVAMQKLLDTTNKTNRVPLHTVPIGDDLRAELEPVREKIIESLPELPSEVSDLFSEGNITPKDLGMLIRAINKRSQGEDNVNHRYIMSTTSVEPKYYDARKSLIDTPVDEDTRKQYDDALKKLDACHNIDLMLAVVAPALDQLEQKLSRLLVPENSFSR